MKKNLGRTLLGLGAVFVIMLAPSHAQAACSNASTAGNWAYTYTGIIFTPNGALPAISVGHFKVDLSGNLSGAQTRSVAGQSGPEDISGTISVNSDCTATASVNVLVDGQLLRTAAIALVFDSSGNHVRGNLSITNSDRRNEHSSGAHDRWKQSDFETVTSGGKAGVCPHFRSGNVHDELDHVEFFDTGVMCA